MGNSKSSPCRTGRSADGAAMKTIPLLPLLLALAPVAALAGEIRLSSLDLSGVEQGWGRPRADRSADGNGLRVGDRAMAHGIGTHAEGVWSLALDGRATRFHAWVGVDTEVGNKGSVEFAVITDGKEAWKSGTLKGGQAAKEAMVPLAGVRQLELVVTDGGDGIDFDHADWGEAVVVTDGVAPKPQAAPAEEAVVLTPKPGPAPRLTGPRVFGARPGSPFLHRVTATGTKPVALSAEGLPPGIAFDAATGRLTGVLGSKGEWKVRVTARNPHGTDQRVLRIVGGDTIALTPPMGWNSWNCFAGAVTDSHIRDAARAMVASGLADHGWTYINIDDYWQVKPSAANDPTLQGPARGPDGRILPNPRFTDMRALTDYVHGLGLKIGLYSSPGPLTCGGCIGSYAHEKLDAASYADWGFDYLKHDWCSYDPKLEKDRPDPLGYRPDDSRFQGLDPSKRPFMIPYMAMQDALRSQKRDIVYSLCQYGMGNVSEWGARVDGNCWRTTGDITDTWSSMSRIGFGQAGLERFAGPGRWNDPDMLVVGHVGWGPALHPTRLTPNEQYTHISLWSLLCSPLLIGCDLTKLDEFTTGLLTNDEIIEINQDPLGKQAARIRKDGEIEVWAKGMEDGSLACGLFNRGLKQSEVSVRFAELALPKVARGRDVWTQKDLPITGDAITARLPRHGCRVFRLWPAR